MPIAVVSDKKMDVIGSHHLVEHAQAEPLLSFEKPLQISAAVSRKFKEKFFLMAAVGEVPNIPGNIMPIRSWHS